MSGHARCIKNVGLAEVAVMHEDAVRPCAESNNMIDEKRMGFGKSNTTHNATL
jgi:hypothetical protein